MGGADTLLIPQIQHADYMVGKEGRDGDETETEVDMIDLCPADCNS